MSDPFAWMVGQVEAAVAAQEPCGSVALSPAMRRVMATAQALGRPISSVDVAQREDITLQHASSLVRRAHKNGVLVPVGEERHGAAVRVLYGLDRKWEGR